MESVTYNVHPIEYNTDLQDWATKSRYWARLGIDVGASTEFSPLTLKALYVTGLVVAICKSVTILLSADNLISATYYPAYGVFASAIELLGRCLRGDETTWKHTEDITDGFKWLASPHFDSYASVPSDHNLVSTINYSYSITELVNLRHFAAHGQGANQAKPQEDILARQDSDRLAIKDFDYFILAEMPSLIGVAIEAYLYELTFNEALAKRLARSLVTPYRNRPIFDALWSFPITMESYPKSIGQALGDLDWTYKSWLNTSAA